MVWNQDLRQFPKILSCQSFCYNELGYPSCRFPTLKAVGLLENVSITTSPTSFWSIFTPREEGKEIWYVRHSCLFNCLFKGLFRLDLFIRGLWIWQNSRRSFSVFQNPECVWLLLPYRLPLCKGPSSLCPQSCPVIHFIHLAPGSRVTAMCPRPATGKRQGVGGGR